MFELLKLNQKYLAGQLENKFVLYVRRVIHNTNVTKILGQKFFYRHSECAEIEKTSNLIIF